tara:strand:+ start:79 stop:462 length:384 start_codon:yes stop_codon:yes gene_type:complete
MYSQQSRKPAKQKKETQKKEKPAKQKKETQKKAKPAKQKKQRKQKTETVELRNEEGKKEKVTFKKGGLHRSMKVPDSYKFRKTQIKRWKEVPVGNTITFKGNKIKVTTRIAKQLDLAATLMGLNKKK